MENKLITYNKLNLLKGIACIAVILIHVKFPGLLGQVVGTASDFAVPVFFMISGYFSYNTNTNTTKRRTRKIARILLVAYIFYLFSRIGYGIILHDLPEFFKSQLTWKTPVKFFVFCTIDYAIVLWYLIAMIEIYLVWYLVQKYKAEALLVKLLPFLFIIQISVCTICDSLKLDWFWRHNFIVAALPWFVLGYFMNSSKVKALINQKSIKIITMIALGFVVATVPILFDIPVKFNYIGYIPIALGMFTLALKNPTKSVFPFLEYIGEKLSLYIYIVHLIIYMLLNVAVNAVFKSKTLLTIWGYSAPFIIIVVSIVFSQILYSCLSQKRKRK